MADSGHGSQKLFEPGRFSVKGLEGIGGSVSNLVLRKSRAERRGEVVPKGIEPMVGHLQDAADIGRLAFVEKEVGAVGVVIAAIAALEEFQRDESIEEIARRSRMESGRPCNVSRSSGCLASSVNTSISIALNSVFEDQNPRPTCRM